ncbi:MAG: DUF2267 domain-containing protein [Nitrospirae bacterium]|nr:DUF2267 domain-containing protein [Nitrospirota bacterium]
MIFKEGEFSRTAVISKEAYLRRVTVLGQYCYPERAEETLRLVFSCLKGVLPVETGRRILEFLPEPVRSIWDDTIPGKQLTDGDCVTLAKETGGYPYRAAAEKAFEVVFASIRELVDDVKVRGIMDLLPSPLEILFVRSKSCALDGSAEDFL